MIDNRIYNEYKMCIRDLIQDKAVQSMKGYIHHRDVTCLEHSIHVSYTSYLACRYLGMDYKSAARGGLLHDFFLYDWHRTKPRIEHGLTHSRIALANANQRFSLNKIEKDIIEKHMWPLTIILPKYMESYVILLIDIYCMLIEVIKGYSINRFADLYDYCPYIASY